MAIIEFATWTATDSYVADRLGGWATMFEILIESGGTKPPFFIGNFVEKPGTEFVSIEWESLEAHERYKNAPRYSEALSEGEKVVLGDFELQHFELNKGPKPAFMAPTTEFATVTLKPETNEDEFLTSWRELLAELGKQQGVHAISWGPSVEKKRNYGLFVGWESVQVHKDAVVQEPFPDIIKRVFELADVDMRHMNVKYGP